MLKQRFQMFVWFVLAVGTMTSLGQRASLAVDGDPAKEPKRPAAPPIPPEQLAAHVKEILRTRCGECHGGSKAQGGIRILDHESLLKQKKKVVPGQPDASELLTLITASEEPMMPPPELPRLGTEDIGAIRQWIATGAVPFPPDVTVPVEMNKDAALKEVVGVDYVLKRILEHVRSLRVDDRPFIRYFSINHLLTGGATRAELDLHRDALAKALNHLTWERRLARLQVIDGPVATVFAVDLRELGWHKHPYYRIHDGHQAGLSKVNLFDLVLLEYPYGTMYEDSETYDHLIEEYVAPCEMVRPVAYVRADWFASTATLPPLYEDLLQLPFHLEELEALLGVPSDDNLRNYVAKRAGMTVSGVSNNNRVVERHPSQYGAYWKSFDFRGSKGLGNMFKDPIYLHPAGGEMVFNLPNGMQGYFVCNTAGRRLEFAPTDIVVDKFAADKTVRNGLSCMRCHEQGIKPFIDTVRPAVEKLPGSVGFDRRDVLNLYIPHDGEQGMDNYIKEDTDRFMIAMTQILGKPPIVEPLQPVSRRFLDAPLQLPTVSAELGLPNPEGLQHLFRTPQFAGLGLIPLASGGVIRRDTWEDYYDQVVRALGLGIPIVPLDGLTRPDYPATAPYLDITLGTTKKNNVVAPGDKIAIVVKNKSNRDVYIELIGNSAKGEQTILAPATTVVKAGGQYRFPEKGDLTVQGGLGSESITLYAGENAFPPGELIRGKGVTDRVIHPFYPTGRRVAGRFDPAQIIKKTLEIETK